jgi:hypothetical protein
MRLSRLPDPAPQPLPDSPNITTIRRGRLTLAPATF